MLVLLFIVSFFNLWFENVAIRGLHDAFVMSAISDPGTLVVVNALEAASEFLVRLPIMALLLSLTGALLNAWIFGQTRTTAIWMASFVPIMCGSGVALLGYANMLNRAARPPFVVSGEMLAGIALSIGVAYLLRAVGDANSGVSWLTWVSPLGWAE